MSATMLQQREGAKFATPSRLVKRRCLASLSSTGTWIDAATKYAHVAINPTTLGGPGGTS